MVYLKIISTTTKIEKNTLLSRVFTVAKKKRERKRVPSFISNGCIPNQMDTERKRYILLVLSERAL